MAALQAAEACRPARSVPLPSPEAARGDGASGGAGASAAAPSGSRGRASSGSQAPGRALLRLRRFAVRCTALFRDALLGSNNLVFAEDCCGFSSPDTLAGGLALLLGPRVLGDLQVTRKQAGLHRARLQSLRAAAHAHFQTTHCCACRMSVMSGSGWQTC
jgi:hypothetical protein